MGFTWVRTIHFGDTDAAGVVFFARYLEICHEAYEEALAAAGVELGTFFADTGTVIPVAKAEIEYLRPLKTGNRVSVALTPRVLSADTFEIRYELVRLGPPAKRAAVARTEHVCLRSASRERVPFPPLLARWLAA